MKNVISIIALLLTLTAFGQSNAVVTNNMTGEMIQRASNSHLSSFGSSATFFNPKRKVEGSVHLFSEWNNRGVIITNEGQKFGLNNININIERNTFEAKISQDTLFTFNFNNIDRFVINNRVFKNFYYGNDNRIFELIYESKDVTIMKGYRVQLVEGSANPMVNRKNDKYVQKSSIFVKRGSKIENFKLNKKKILDLFNDPEKVKKIESYANSNKLSFKKEEDVKKILSLGLQK